MVKAKIQQLLGNHNIYAPEDNSPIGKISSFASQYAIWIVGGILLKDLITNFMNKSDGGGIIGG
jgi:galactitol-specific phosphotransferase system IIB component